MNPITRQEMFLAAASGEGGELPKPITREEMYLKKIAENGGGGGTGGTTNYNALSNKPKINSVELSGNKSLADLGIPTKTSQLTNDDNVVKDAAYVHTDNNYDATAKNIVEGVNAALSDKVDNSKLGAVNGVAQLGEDGKLLSSQMPGSIDHIIEAYYNDNDGKFYEEATYETEIAPQSSVIYVSLDTNKTYRWSGTQYVEISASLALGETAQTAYPGNKGKANADAIDGILDGTNIDSFADVETALSGKINTTSRGAANGVAGLDANGKVPTAQLPDLLGLGETAQTAYAGDKGKANADAITAIKDGVNIDSFADVETALGDKADKVNSATNGNFAGLDASGNLTDSGKKASDFASATALTDEIKRRFTNNCKNVLPIRIANQTARGVTFTRNANDSYSLSGTCTGNPLTIDLFSESVFTNTGDSSAFKIEEGINIDKTKPYILTRGDTQIRFTLALYQDGVSVATVGFDSTGGNPYMEIDFSSYTFNQIKAIVRFGNNTNYTSKTFTPMLCLKSDYQVDSSQQYFAKTNKQLTDETVTWDNLSEVGAVNYLVYPYSETTHTSSNIIYTDNGDGSITVGTGTTSSGSPGSYAIANNTKDIQRLRGKAVKFSIDCDTVVNGSNANVQMAIYDSSNNLLDNHYLHMNGGRDKTILTVPSNADHVYIQAWNKRSTTISTAYTVKPMITPVSYNGPYVPYAKSNRELTEKIDIVGNLFTTTTKVVDNITHGIATTVATLENLPIGTYVVSGQFNSDSAMSGGGLVQFASSGVIQNGASCSTIINQGFKANAGLTGIFNVTNATNQINLQIYTANADLTVASARLAAIRIA